MDEDLFLLENTLIIANPGTGKTTSLATQTADILLKGGKESEILCITFTKKAAGEMRERISNEITRKKLNANPSDLEVHTFHSYALSFLNNKGFDFDLASNNLLRYSILNSFLEDNVFNYQRDYIIDSIVPKCENAIRYLKSYGILPDSVNLQTVLKEVEEKYAVNPLENFSIEEEKKFLKSFIDAYRRYEEEKKGLGNVIDYNDMLLKFLEEFDNERRFKYVLVDELQDVNELEAEIAKLSGHRLFLVGDRKQSIFGFQGGSLKIFNDFQMSGGFKKIVLGNNYRSLQEILDYAKWYFYNYLQDTSYKEELEKLRSERNGARGEVKVIKIANSKVSDNARAAVETYVKVEKKQGERTAIITRTNAQLNKISRILDSKNIKYSTTSVSYVSDQARKEIINFLRGLLDDDKDSIIGALFTPFSGISLKEAFEISKQWNSKSDQKSIPDNIEELGSPFFKKRKDITVESLDNVFKEIIIPISFKLGKEYYFTAQMINQGMLEFFDAVKVKTKEAFINFISVLDQDYEPREELGDLVLTTVHKAKGREFDNVIYLPTSIKNNLSFIDLAVNSIIKATKGIDVSEELSREAIRVDFVAFTRAKDKLFIIPEARDLEKYSSKYAKTELCELNDEIEPISNKYEEAYNLFIHQRFEDAKKLLENREKWLLPKIKEYFSGIREISYSEVESMLNPYEYFKERILKISEPRTEALLRGVNVHKIALSLFNGTLDVKRLTEEELNYLENIKKVNEELSRLTNSKQMAAEMKVEQKLGDVFSEFRDNLTFKGFIDALFESQDGDKKNYVILDYKTDRNDNRSSDHRRQLAVYRKLLASKMGIDEGNITIAIGYVGLRGNINTGKNECRLDLGQDKKGQIETFIKHLKNFLEYQNDAIKFIEKIMEKEINEPLYWNIIDQLKYELQNEL